MKKTLILIAAAIFTLTSCDDLLKNNKEQGNEETPGVIEKPEQGGKPTEELAPSAQKVKLEEVAEALMDEYPATEFEDFFSLADRFSEKYLENVSDQYWDQFYDYCEARGEEMFFFTDKESEKNGEIYRSWSVEGLLEFSKINGILTLGESSATCNEYDGTKMVFTLDGKEYIVEIKALGKEVKAIYTLEQVYGHESYVNGYYDEDKGYWVDEYVMIHYNDNYDFEVLVPEKISMVITKNGADFAVVDLSFVRRFNEAGVNITTDCFQVIATITIDGHSVVIDKTGYDAASGKAGVSYTLKKDSEVIISAVATADVKVELVTENEEWEGGYDSYIYPEFNLAKDFDIYVDILGQIQIIGKCTDGVAVSEYINNFYDAETDTQAERAIDNINNYIDLGLYYDKSVTRQAEIIMDYYLETNDYDDFTWYELEPVIRFPDGSKYAFYEYFDEDSFAGVTNSFELWIEMYETMLDHYFE